MSVICTSDEFERHIDNYDGVCLGCFEWTIGGVEPDAHGYKCANCGEHQVMGAEGALLSGRIEFSDDDC